jgi:hypothetical protein
MSDILEPLFASFIGAVAGLFLGLLIQADKCREIQREAIDAGAARYDVDHNGKSTFVWNNGMRSTYQQH